MADKNLTYSVKLDAASAQAQAAQLRAIFHRQLQNIQINLLDPGALNNALSATQGIRAQLDAAANSSQSAVLALQQANANQLVTQYGQVLQDAQQTAQAMQQAATAQPQRPQQPIGGGQTGGNDGFFGGGIGGAVAGGLAGYLTVQGIQQIAQQTVAFAEFGTQVRRTEASFKILSGSASEAEARINAIKAAGGGAVSELQAMELANQAVSLHLASTAQEFGNLTKAGREIALVSPVIHDVQGAISELGSAAANLSYRRLDQLGLSATEVKDRIKELQAANSGLDDSQAFLQASIETLDKKYGDLLKTQEAQASGVERLKVAWDDLWASIAKGSTIDNMFGRVADSIDVMTGKFDYVKQQLNEGIPAALKNLDEQANRGVFARDTSQQTAFLKDIQQRLQGVSQALATNQPGAQAYAQALVSLAQTTELTGTVTADQVDKLKQAAAAYNEATTAAQRLNQQTLGDNPEERRLAAQAQLAAAQAARQQRLDDLFAPITKLGNDLKGAGLDNFFQQLHNGLAASAEITATENNHLATMRQQLVDIGRAVADSGGQVTESQRNQVEAINRQIEALSRASELNKKFQEASTPQAPGQNLDAIYQRLNAIVAQTRGEFDQLANKAREYGDAIAQAGTASADQLAGIDQLAAQANQADFAKVTQGLRELNSGSLDAVPGVDSLREKFEGFYETLSSGQGLTAAQASELAGLSAEADALGGSSSALAEIQNTLGYAFLNSNTYASGLVGQIAYLEMLYGSGKIGADEFAGGMSYLTGELGKQLQAAGKLTPELARLLTMLNAVNAAAGGQVGPAGPFFGGFPGGGVNRNGAGYQEGIDRAKAAAEIARSKADATARDEAIKAQKKAAGAAQNAFEDAAKGTQKAFEAVVDDMRSALQKVEGLFSPSKVTAEDIAASKAGVYQPKADELLRQVKSAAENPADVARFASQIAQAKEALSKIGVAPAENIKALAAQLEQAWSSSALFANKDNLKLINADAVKLQLNLQAKAKEGQQNIYEYFGATLDGVKEKFAAKDPTIVEAVAAELQGSQDKNLKALGKSLEDGINGAVEKTLKNLAAAEAGFAKGAGGGGGGGVSAGASGGSSGSGGAPAWYEKANKNVSDAYSALADYYQPPAIPPKTNQYGVAGGLIGPPAPNGTNTTGLAPTELTGKVKITSIDLDPAMVTAFEDTLYNTFAAQTSRPADIGKGIAQVIGVSMSQADLSAPANTYMQALATAFGGATPSPKTLGEALDNAIQNGFIRAPRGSDMATGFVNALSASFGTYAANYTAIGDTISYSIESAIANRTERLDMAGNFIIDLANQFGNADAITTYESTGSNISYIIESSIANRTDRLDMASSLIKDLSTQLGQQDYSVPALRFTNGLRSSFGADSDQFNAIGQGVAQFIGLGITDYDLSGVGSTVIGNVSASFTGDSVRAQLQGVGSAISGAIFAGFASSLAYQPWFSTLVQTVVSQAMESMTNSINDSLQVQAVGV